MMTPLFFSKNEKIHNVAPIIKIGNPVLLTLIPDALIAVISLFFCNELKVKIVEINIDIGRAILRNRGIVYI